MTTPRFLIAKYVPDLARMEPRNFGVFVWNEGTVHMKCIRDKSEGIRRLKLKDKEAYEQWIQYWDVQCSRSSIKRRDGTLVERDSPEFVDAFRATASGNYILADGGDLLQKVRQEETADLANELFATLVTDFEHREEGDKTQSEAQLLKKSLPRLLHLSGMLEQPGFQKSGYNWVCPVGDTQQAFYFDYAIHNASPKCVLQKVQLTRQASVHHAAFMFDAMCRQYLKREKCASLVYATDEDLRDDNRAQAYRLLKSCGVVVNVADESNAKETLTSLALGA